jgi:hypothetical protein
MGNVVPVGARRDASATELEDNERPNAARGNSRRHDRKAPGREWKLEFVVFEIAELPFQTALGEDVLEFAPGRTAFLYPSFGLGSPIDAIDDAIVVVILFGSAVKEFLVEVEVVVVSLAHHLIPVR